MLKKRALVVGPFQCNCTILICEETKEAVIVDPGDDWVSIQKVLKEENVKLKFALHTHAHLDHIGASRELKNWSNQTKLCLHKEDRWLFENLQMQGQLFGFQYDKPPALDLFLEDGQELDFGKYKFSVIHTPGHSPGGVCFSFKEKSIQTEPVIFTGDTLFQQSIGRTDLWGADHGLLLKSIKQRLFSLDEQTSVFPGHGPSTTIGFEKRENPFF
ncbi:MAG: MBL fold metallo-hydrolase [Bacteriovoracia bacterium]